MRLDEHEMTATKQRNYLQKVLKDAEKSRKQAVAFKSNATKAGKAGRITPAEVKLRHDRSDKLQKNIKEYMKYHESQLNSIKGSGLRRGQRGRGAYFFNDAKEMLKKLTLIIAEMEAGNTSIKMRNMGQTILDALLHANHLNKVQLWKISQKIFRFIIYKNGKRNNIK